MDFIEFLLVLVKCLLGSVLVLPDVVIELVLPLDFLFCSQFLVVIESHLRVLAVDVRVAHVVRISKLIQGSSLPALVVTWLVQIDRFSHEFASLPKAFVNTLVVEETLTLAVSLHPLEVPVVDLTVLPDFSTGNDGSIDPISVENCSIALLELTLTMRNLILELTFVCVSICVCLSAVIQYLTIPPFSFQFTIIWKRHCAITVWN